MCNFFAAICQAKQLMCNFSAINVQLLGLIKGGKDPPKKVWRNSKTVPVPVFEKSVEILLLGEAILKKGIRFSPFERFAHVLF